MLDCLVVLFLGLAFHQLVGLFLVEDEVGQVGGIFTGDSLDIVVADPPDYSLGNVRFGEEAHATEGAVSVRGFVEDGHDKIDSITQKKIGDVHFNCQIK